jgi:hypothetical protein
LPPKRNTPVTPQNATDRYTPRTSRRRGPLSSRNAGQIQIQFSTVADSVEDPDFFTFYENRGSGEKLEAHLAAPHLVGVTAKDGGPP